MKRISLIKHKPNLSASSPRKRGTQCDKIPAFAGMTLDCSVCALLTAGISYISFYKICYKSLVFTYKHFSVAVLKIKN
jgi:hypothetical protein